MRSAPRRFGLCLLGAALLGQAGASYAQGAGPFLAECAAIDNERERLACYDRAAGREPDVEIEPRPAAAPPGEGAAEGSESPSPASPPRPSMIDAAWGFRPDSRPNIIDLYNPNYFLLARYSTHVNNQPFTPVFPAADTPPQDIDSTEAKFQVSFKTRIWTTGDRRWGLWAAYTQQSQWQVYNGATSRPFRETNYMPEFFVSYRPDVAFGGFHWRLLNAGFNHQSNGRSNPLSRSWNRIFAEVGLERDDLAVFARVWYRSKESAGKDDNPDITDFYGHGELRALYRWHRNSFAAMVRGNVSTRKGAYQLSWTSPRFLGPLRGYIQLFSGYGESMIDYNWKQTTIGAGIALNDEL
jgi:phospholipase A1